MRQPGQPARPDCGREGTNQHFVRPYETGTLILTDKDTSRRLGALAPWLHVAVLRRATIFPDLTAAVAALPADPNIIWVTGPSKTADVEGILIEGVHGPGIQVALVVS